MTGTWGEDGHEHEWIPLPDPKDGSIANWQIWEKCKHCHERRENPLLEGPLE